MKIKALRSLGAGWPSLKEDEIGDVDHEVGEKLIKLGLAAALANETPAVIHAVPPVAVFNTAPAAEATPIVAVIPVAPEPTVVLNQAAVEPTEENTAPVTKLADKKR